MSTTLYECTNPQCTLGSANEPGHFTGGITADQVNLLTGTPVENLTEGEDHGEGICPNCGKKGEPVGTHEFHPDNGSVTQTLDDGTVTEVPGVSAPDPVNET